MTKNNQTPAAHRRLLTVMAGELGSQCCTAQAAQGKPAFEDELGKLLVMAELFEETACAVFRLRLGREPSVWDYCPKIAEPSFAEISHRLDDLILHIENLGNTDNFFTHGWLAMLVRLSAYFVGAVEWLAGESDPEALEGLEVEVLPISAKAGFADFSHRLSPVGLESGTLGLLDTVNMAADKLLATVGMLADHFALDDDDFRPSDETVFFALQSIKHEAQDIKAVMAGFHSNEKL
jgi:hypothetical protein